MIKAKDKERLVVFWYGFSLIIPFFIILHSMKGHLGAFWVVLFIIGLLWIISQVYRNRVLCYFSLLVIHSGAIAVGVQKGFGVATIIFLSIAYGFFLLTFNQKFELLRPIYDKWMGVAHFIGNIIFTILFAALYYLIFAVAGIVLRLIRKDLLDRTIKPSQSTYWVRKETQDFEKNSYTKQF